MVRCFPCAVKWSSEDRCPAWNVVFVEDGRMSIRDASGKRGARRFSAVRVSEGRPRSGAEVEVMCRERPWVVRGARTRGRDGGGCFLARISREAKDRCRRGADRRNKWAAGSAAGEAVNPGPGGLQCKNGSLWLQQAAGAVVC
jgi:hypothetical protein